MRSILRSTLLASCALTATWGLSGCEDTTKTTTPPATTGTEAGGKMEPAKDKMEPAPAPATPPAEPPK